MWTEDREGGRGEGDREGKGKKERSGERGEIEVKRGK